MHYSIIYSVDVPRGVNMRPYVPPDCRKLWEETEGDRNRDYLGDEWERGHHRKWVAILDQQQFEEFVVHCELIGESTETMGSIGAPGYGLGWAPAISFRGDAPDAIQSAYVTPGGTATEIATFLREHEVVVPGVLTDAEGQGYLYDGVPEDEGQTVWAALKECVLADAEDY